MPGRLARPFWRERAGPSLPPSCVVATCCSCSAGGFFNRTAVLTQGLPPVRGNNERSLRCYAPERGKPGFALGGAGAYGSGFLQGGTPGTGALPAQAWIIARGHEDPDHIAYASGNSVVPVRERGRYELVIASRCIGGGRNPVAGAHLETAYLGAAGISGARARRLQRRGGQPRARPAGQRAAAAVLGEP